jgi:ribosome recycling factor
MNKVELEYDFERVEILLSKKIHYQQLEEVSNYINRINRAIAELYKDKKITESEKYKYYERADANYEDFITQLHANSKNCKCG